MKGLWEIITPVSMCATLVCLLASLPAVTHAQEPGTKNVVYDSALYQALKYRMIGPHRGSRVTAVSGVASQRETFYMGAPGGGVWKTTGGGEIWENVSDGYFKVGSIGAIAVADSDPNVVYVGTGSACVRGNVSAGIGVYKSSDAGESWKHIGLDEVGQIGRIRVHPKNADLVYVATLGHIFGPNEQRGVFRSKDGGRTWEKVLYISEKTGAIDIAMDANNPRVLYAAMWTADRKPWALLSGSEEGGVHKTTDGGDTWTELTNGLPTGITGRTGVAVSPANSSRVWALVEAEEGGVFRSDDAGTTFRRINKERGLQNRPFYYMHIFADPKDENTVYIATRHFVKSVDGGKTFGPISVPHGDQHDLWLNPHDPNIMIESNDGGANISFNGGKSWSTQLNQPTAEIYRVTVDNQFPYRVYGSEQDQYNAISVPSRSANFGAKLHLQHWYGVGGFEGGHVAVHPENPNIVYGGGPSGKISRYDRSTGQIRQLKVYPETGGTAANLRYRFQWTAPIRLSPHDPNILYHTSQYVHKSNNEGQSWELISPDLTTNDKAKQDYSSGPITRDGGSAEIYTTIFAFEESPKKPGLLWAGSDDGLIHISQNGGASWDNITPEGLPEWGTVNTIDLSAHDPGRAFVAVHRYRLDDFKPYIFRTSDYGKSWKLLTDGTNGIPANHFVRVAREDPDRKGLLYAGTEFGMYISFDDGTHWQSLQLNLPVTPITDMVVHQKDLVMSTQGRSFWILDDLTPLHQITDQVAGSRAYLFQPRDAYRVRTSEEEADQVYVAGRENVTNPRDPIGGARIERHRMGTEAPDGAIIYSYFAKKPEEEVTLEILDLGGNVIRRFSSQDEPKDKSVVARPEPPWLKEESTFSKAGLNRFVWDLRYPGAEVVENGTLSRQNTLGPKAVPGTYQARVTAGEWSQTQSFEVQKDPRLETTQADYQQQFDLLTQIRNKIGELHHAVSQTREVREQVSQLVVRLKKTAQADEAEKAGNALIEKLTAIEWELVPTEDDYRMDRLNFPSKLHNQFTYLYNYVGSADTKPTDGSYERFEDLKPELAKRVARLREVIETELPAFNALNTEP